MQSPGVRAQSDPAQHGRLRDYVTAIVSAFAHDARVLAWDIWNEPHNDHDVHRCDPGVLAAKARLVAPLLCTGFMARPTGSTFEAVLPFAKKARVGAFCWGLVVGRTQTHFAWDARHNGRIAEGRAPWFHDVLHPDGRPHLPREAAFLRSITGRAQQAGA